MNEGEEDGMNQIESTDRLYQTALGQVPPDTVITNGTVFNGFTGEFIQGQSIWIKDGMIAYVGPEKGPVQGEGTVHLDVEGMVLLPGLIEGHTHVIGRTGIEEFVKHVIPGGVTTVITETIELATVVGKDGIEHFVKGLENQPIRFYYTVPALCGLTPAEEVYAPSNEELLPFLRDPKCLGLGEIYWGNALISGSQGERVRELASMALTLGKRVEGHTSGASGQKLQAYTALGVSSCHEPITDTEVLERLRLGYRVMIREGGIRRELDGVKGIFDKEIDFRRLILSTDSMDPEGFLEEGYLDAAVRKALGLGVPPALAYQMVTINVAEHFRLDHILGSLAPGKSADLVMIPAPDQYEPRLVMCEGKTIFQDGKALFEPKQAVFPEEMFHTVAVPKYTIPPLPIHGKVRAAELVNRLVTRERIIDLQDPEDAEDLIMALALDRRGGEGAFAGLIKGFGLQRGACGSTMCWDTVDMIVVGRDPQSMQTVIGRLKELGGGAVFAIEGKVVAEFPAPLCGFLSIQPMEVARDQIRHLEVSLKRHGVPWEKPLLTIDTLGTAAIPHLRLTHHGYVRLRDREVLPLEV